jgi:pyridoxamine--pyruvate transaminase
MAISPDAWQVMERKASPLRGSYLSLLDWKETWLAQHTFPYTPSVSLIYALESVLNQVLEVGVERWAARHEQIARACRAGIRGLGLELWPVREEIAAPCVTAVRVPDDIRDEDLRRHLRQRYGVMISGGYGELAGQLFRLGHMGKAAHPTYLAAQLAMLERSLVDLGHQVPLGAGVGAALAALSDWDEASA